MNKNDKKKHQSTKGLIDPSKVKTFVVHHECDLLSFLREKIPSQSQHNIRHMISNHQVAVGGAPVSLFRFALFPEDEVTVTWNPIRKRERKDLPIIYEDEDILAINKSSGLLSVASEREKGKTAYRMVSDYIAQKDRNARIFVVHRLDEDTSGVLIFAKSYATKEALQLHWQEIVEKRGYYAIVEGEDIPEAGRLRDYLTIDDTYTVHVTRDKKKGKLAITNYKKIAAKGGYSLLDVNIETGRKNQIRAQLGHLGYYVIGDDRYGEPSDPLKRLGLHAYELIFTNPLSKKRYDLKSEMPENFKRLFWKTRKQVSEEEEKKKEKPLPEKKPESRKRMERRKNQWPKRKKQGKRTRS